MMEAAQKNPAAANLVHSPASSCWRRRAGQVSNDRRRNGVGGAPGGHLDEQCAIAALDKVKDQLK